VMQTPTAEGGRSSLAPQVLDEPRAGDAERGW
jgi:hypothetical protein